MKRLIALLMLLLLPVLTRPLDSYSVLGYVWSGKTYSYYINPTNGDIRKRKAKSAILKAAEVWSLWCRGSYAGITAVNSVANDGINAVFFRPASNGAAIATTYTFYSGRKFLGFDMVFWDQTYRFYAEDQTCAAGYYIYDIATHEFGHAIGMGHTNIGLATMFPDVPSCATYLRTLATDDIMGVSSIY